MTRKKIIFIFTLIATFFLISINSFSNAFTLGKSPNHSERDWKVIETEHFFIHYYQGYEKLANEISNIAEEIYFKITQDLGASPNSKVPIILTQDQFFNGYAEPIKNRIVLDTVLCKTSFMGARRFLAHEFTHIITYEAFNTGLSISKLYIFGNLPVWFMEGIAQYEAEYWYPSYDRMLRLSTLERSILTPSQRNVFTVLGDYEGSAGYNEGYAIVKYTFEKYGRDKLKKVLKTTKENGINFYKAFEDVIGKPFLVIEAEWRLSLEEKYQKQMESRKEFASNSKEIIKMEKQEANIKPKISPNGKIFTYMSSKGRDGFVSIRGNILGFMPIYANILGDDTESTKIVGKDTEKFIFTEKDAKGTLLTGSVLDYSWSPYSDIIAYTRVSADEVGQPDVSLGFLNLSIEEQKVKTKKIFNYPYKIYSNLEEKKSLNLISSPTFSPSGNKLAFAGVENEINNIYTINISDLENKNQEIHAIKLTNTKDYSYKDLAWSPDGKYIACIVYTAGFGGNLGLININSNEIKLLTNSSTLTTNSNPVWNGTSNKIYFSSDLDGISNIYVADFEKKEIKKLTNSYRGLEFPFVSNEELYFSSYYAKGTDIRKVSLDDNFFSIEPMEEKIISEKNNIEIKNHQATNYFPSLTPDMIIPITAFDEKGDQIGLKASVSDMLDIHSFDLAIAYGLISSKLSYSIGYVNRMFDPVIGVQFSEFPSIAVTKDGKDYYYQRTPMFTFLMARPFFNELSQRINNIGSLEFSTGYMNPILTEANSNTDSKLIRKGWNNFIALNWTSQDVSGNLSDIHPEDGFKLDFRLEKGSKLLKSDFDYTQFLFDFRRYIPLWFDHVMYLRSVMQWSFGDVTPLLLGGSPVTLNLGYQNFVPLRGYNLAELIGDRLNLLSLEYRFPILTGINTTFSGIYIDGLYGAGFIDVGDAWFSGTDNYKLNIGGGGELRLRLAIGDRSSLGVFVGVGRKLTQASVNQFYFGFSNSF